MTVYIDQPRCPEGRSRCQHDLLDNECAWCRGDDEADTVFGQ